MACRAPVHMWRYSNFVRQRSFQHCISRSNSRSVRLCSSRSEVIVPDAKYSNWLYGCSGLVFGIVCIGGLTRLTESGLSIVEWKPVSGVSFPNNADAWNKEFDKYKEFPEYERKPIDLNQFKFIYFLEWFHRIFGRVIGMAYLLPLGFFYSRLSRPTVALPKTMLAYPLLPLAALLGSQGLIGWIMVSTGLKHDTFKDGRPVRVSQYSLTAHLMAAIALYTGFFWTAMSLRKPAPLAEMIQFQKAIAAFRPAMLLSMILCGCTMFMGGITAGLDAGLVYAEWPTMGGRFLPTEAFPEGLAFLNHDVTAQWTHRTMAYLTTLSIVSADALLWKNRAVVPQQARRMMLPIRVALGLQLTLGVSTVLSCVSTPVAACHQLGALVLWTTLLKAWFRMRLQPHRRLLVSALRVK